MRQSPLQNKVNPKGKICAVPQRGTYMGNRGILHDENQEVLREFRLKSWIICKLDFKYRQRKIMAPKRYTELFFLDEATAFSAGHRPCAECQRVRFNEFKNLWIKANRHLHTLKTSSIKEIDEIIHTQRIDSKRKKITYFEKLKNLPNGTFIQINLSPFIIWENRIYEWTFNGYKIAYKQIDKKQEVEVLTPISFVNMLKNGFKLEVHKTLLELL